MRGTRRTPRGLAMHARDVRPHPEMQKTRGGPCVRNDREIPRACKYIPESRRRHDARSRETRPSIPIPGRVGGASHGRLRTERRRLAAGRPKATPQAMRCIVAETWQVWTAPSRVQDGRSGDRRWMGGRRGAENLSAPPRARRVSRVLSQSSPGSNAVQTSFRVEETTQASPVSRQFPRRRARIASALASDSAIEGLRTCGSQVRDLSVPNPSTTAEVPRASSLRVLPAPADFGRAECMRTRSRRHRPEDALGGRGDRPRRLLALLTASARAKVPLSLRVRVPHSAVRSPAAANRARCRNALGFRHVTAEGSAAPAPLGSECEVAASRTIPGRAQDCETQNSTRLASCLQIRACGPLPLPEFGLFGATPRGGCRRPRKGQGGGGRNEARTRALDAER